MTKMDYIYLLSDILKCGYADVNFILRLENDFGKFDWKNTPIEKLEANNIIYAIFYHAFRQVCEELKIDPLEFDVKILIYGKYLDSHLYLYDKDGNCEDMKNMKHIRDFLTFHCKKDKKEWAQNIL
jgi:hypothetical protein